MRIAIVSDTHGLLRPQVVERIRHVDTIIHAGDVGKLSVLDALSSIAPTHAVRGNVDTGEWAARLPLSQLLTFDGSGLFVIHDVGELKKRPPPPTARLVVFGHSHKPANFTQDGLRYLNPGSIGPRRFTLPISFALLDWTATSFSIKFITLS